MTNPKLIATPFAQEGERSIIQETVGEFPNSATYQKGFPPTTMKSSLEGGIPPKGTDFNGIFYDITENLSFQAKGGRYKYSSEFSTKIGGYPLGATLLLDDNVTEVVSEIESNLNNPNIDMIGWILKPNKTTAENVFTKNGKTQQEINDSVGADWYAKIGGYSFGDRVRLSNGDIARNIKTDGKNPNNPNTNMSGWELPQAKDVYDANGKSQQEVNTFATFFGGKKWFAPLYGVKGDGVTNDSPALQSIINLMSDGDILVVMPKKHKLNTSLSITKSIKITSESNRHQTSTALFDCTGNGIVFKNPWIEWDGISLVGTQTGVVLDPANRVFGNIGFKHEYSGTYSTSGVITRNCFVTYFDTNIAEYQEGSGTWAGAYRSYYDVFSRYGRIGYAAVDGSTFNNWFGGAIQFCSEYGIYSDASQHEYNNTMLHGTAIEKCGKKYSDGDYVFGEKLAVGVYSGKNAKVFLVGSYTEDTSLYATNGGKVWSIASHQQRSNSRFFAGNGAIKDDGGFGDYSNTINFVDRYSTLFTGSNATVTGLSSLRKTLKAASTTSGAVSLISRSIRLDSIHAKDLQAVKFNIGYKFNSGYTANTDLLIEPVLRITSATAGSSDTSRTNANFPLQILKQTYGQWNIFSFVWIPRVLSGYIDPTSMLASLQITLNVKNGTSNPNFSVDALDMNIDFLNIQVVSACYAELSTDIAKTGATASRPTNLSTLEVGTAYYDTTESRNYIWSGTAWIKQKSSADDMFASYSTAQLTDATNTVNTTYKLTSNFVYNNTNGKMYYRTGTTATSPWRATDNSGDITPV